MKWSYEAAREIVRRVTKDIWSETVYYQPLVGSTLLLLHLLPFSAGVLSQSHEEEAVRVLSGCVLETCCHFLHPTCVLHQRAWTLRPISVSQKISLWLPFPWQWVDNTLYFRSSLDDGHKKSTKKQFQIIIQRFI